jgi:hypothetical protein
MTDKPKDAKSLAVKIKALEVEHRVAIDALAHTAGEYLRDKEAAEAQLAAAMAEREEFRSCLATTSGKLFVAEAQLAARDLKISRSQDCLGAAVEAIRRGRPWSDNLERIYREAMGFESSADLAAPVADKKRKQ